MSRWGNAGLTSWPNKWTKEWNALGREDRKKQIIEAVKGDRDALTREAADVIYHLLVTLAACDVDLQDVLAELERRQNTSGIAEKQARTGEV